MNKQELIASVAEKMNTSKTSADAAVTAVFESIAEALKEDQTVAIMGFGSFKAKTRPARVGRHPQTKAEIQIPASKTVAFKIGKSLKESL